MPPPALNNSGTNDRFSLLLLEPGEIYFTDMAVTYCSHPESRVASEAEFVRGRLKICSKSIVFVPHQSSDPANPDKSPLIKYPLQECKQIKEWFPKSFQSILAKETNVISVQVGAKVLMMADNKVAPFKFTKVEPLQNCVFALKYGKVDDYLPLMNQLRRAATLPPVEQNGMIAAIVYSTQRRTEFDNCWLESVDEKILLKTVGNKITPLVVNPGKIVLTSITLYFQPYNNAEEKPVIKVKLSSIKRIFQRRYLLRPLGLEIEFTNIKNRSDHIYLTFSKPEERKKLYHKLVIARQELELKIDEEALPEHPLANGSMDKTSSTTGAGSNIVSSLSANMDEENMTLQWQNGLITNFEYLLYLNSAADRSFNDLTQYPVVPWIISDYSSKVLDLEDPKSFRDLSKPMGALNLERLEGLKERTRDMPEPRFLYGSHYSTPGFVLYFLARKIPECMLCLQNGRFDHPDRMFNSIPQTWMNVTTHPSDFKELVPEFYMPEFKGDFLLNTRGIDFGVRFCGTPVGNVELPPWASSPEDFVQKLSKAMESDYVSKNLHKWIDLIFGYKQRGKNADLADNLFYHLCYEGSVDLDTINDLEARYALELQIGEFGQVPKQLFTSPHPQRMASSSKTSVKAWPKNNYNRNSLIGGSDDEDGGDPESNPLFTYTQWKTSMKDLRMVCDYKAHKERVSTVAISADKLWIFSASHDNVLKMYSLEEMSLLRNVSIGSGGKIIISTCFPLPNNQTVLLGSMDHSICAYSIEHARFYEFDDAHRDAISCMDWRNGILATGSWDGSVKVWHCTEASGHLVNADSDYFVAALDHSSQVSAVSICPDNSRQLVAGTRDGNVVLWCLKTASIIQELPSHKRQVNGVKFSPDAKRVVSCGSDFFMKVIDLRTGSILFSRDLGEELNCLAFDGRTVLVGGASGFLNLWDIHAVKPCGKIAAHKGPVTCIWVSDDGEVVATGGEDRRVVVWTTKPLIANTDV